MMLMVQGGEDWFGSGGGGNCCGGGDYGGMWLIWQSGAWGLNIKLLAFILHF